MLSHTDDAFDVFRQLYVSSSDGEDDKDDKDDAPPTAVQVDLPKFIGKWAQMYASLGPKYTFELGGRDVTALYSPTSRSGVLSVLNTTKPSRILPAVQKRGYAVRSNAHSGIFHVSFSAKTEAEAHFVEPGNFWIIGLGPVVNGLYDWALISDSTKSSLYILTRDIDRFAKIYERRLLALVDSLGYTKEWNKPRKTSHR